MNVGELIEELSQFNPELNVYMGEDLEPVAVVTWYYRTDEDGDAYVTYLALSSDHRDRGTACIDGCDLAREHPHSEGHMQVKGLYEPC